MSERLTGATDRAGPQDIVDISPQKLTASRATLEMAAEFGVDRDPLFGGVSIP